MERFIVFVAGGALHYYDTVGAQYKQMGSGFSSGKPYSFSVMNDTLYIANGEDKVRAFDGTTRARDAGITKPATTPTTAIAANPKGGAPVGTYRYRVSFLNSRNIVLSNPSEPTDPITTVNECNAYATGTVTTTINNDSVVGAATVFDSSPHEGAVFAVDGDAATYIVKNVLTTTSFELDRPYESKTAAARAYKIYGQKVALTAIPTSGDRQVTARRLYRTDGSDPERYYYLADISNNTATIHTDNVSDESLGLIAQQINDAGELEFRDAAPPRLGFLSGYKGRLFGAGDKDKPNYLYYSDITKPESWGPDTFNFIDFDENDGDEITGIGQLPNMLVIFKRDSIHALMGDAPSNFVRRRLVSDAGCVSHNSIVEVGRMLMWFGEDNVFSFDGGEIRPLAGHIAPTIRALNTERQQFIQGVHYQRRRQVWWTVTSGSGSTNNRILALHYDLLGERGEPVWTVFDIRAASLAEVEEADDNTVIYHGDYFGYLHKNDVLYNDGAGSTGTVMATADSGTVKTLKDNDAAFVTANDGLRGCLLRIIAGVGSGQERTIDSNTASILTVTADWATNPSTNSRYVVAPIRGYISTSKSDFQALSDEKRAFWMRLQVSDESEATA